MTSRRIGLVLAALIISGLMLAVVPFVTNVFGPLAGFVCVLTIYWVCFCIPISVIYGRGPTHVEISPSATKPWIAGTALALPVFVFLAAEPISWLGFEPGILAVAVICALINGSLEELAWRRTFRASSDNDLSYELLGLGLFTLWHLPLYFSESVSFDHGAVGLMGGALVSGAVWTFMTRASDSIGWPIVSHTLVNIAAFPPLFASNFSVYFSV